MHPDTRRELIEQGSGVIGTLLKELLVHRQRKDRLETEKELEIELARERRRAREQNQRANQQPPQRQQPQRQPRQQQSQQPDEQPTGLGGTPAASRETSDPHVTSIAEAIHVGDTSQDQIRLAQSATDCQFCHNVLEQLKSASPEERQRAFDELIEYESVVDELVAMDADAATQEERIDELMDSWETIPQLLAG